MSIKSWNIGYNRTVVVAVARSERSYRRQNEVKDTSEVKTNLSIRILVRKTFGNNIKRRDIDNFTNELFSINNA